MKKRLFLFIGLMCIFYFSYSQIDVKSKIKEKTNQRIETKTDEGIDNGLNKVEEGIGNLFKKKEKKEKTENAETSEPLEEVAAPVKTDDTPKIKSYTKYDFVAGDKILFYDDFSQDAVGDFPALWTTDGSGEIRTVDQFPGNFLYMNTKDKVYNLMKNLDLPKNFIFEFDVILTPGEEESTRGDFYFTFYNSEKSEFLDNDLYPDTKGVHFTISESGWDVKSYKEGASETLEGSSTISPVVINQMCHVILWVQGRRARMYHDGKKVFDMPTIIYEGTNPNRLRFSLWSCSGLPFISNLKITTAAPDTRSKLITEGKLVTYGITFDSGKDQIKSESYGTLADIAKVLNENPTVRVKIIGHTDSDGNAPSNLDLSKKRAISVKNYLVANFKIDSSRLETDGKGQTQTVAPNTTSEGKAKNRRVEFLKL